MATARSAIVGYERLHRVGVELEGVWKGDHPIGRYDSQVGGAINRDGSLDRFGRNDRIVYDTTTGSQVTVPELGVTSPGEITSNPPVLPLTSIDLMEAFVNKYYPDYVDSTCGLHIHMSTVMRWTYSKLVAPEYAGDSQMGEEGAIFRAIREWATKRSLPNEHPIWKRLEGNNQFCLRSFKADAQAKAVDKGYNHGAEEARYTAIAYHWNRRGADSKPMRTVECRMLPMFESKALAIEALKVVMQTTNDFINREAPIREPVFFFQTPNMRGKSVTRRVVKLRRRG